MGESTYTIGSTVQIAPADLLLQRNVREAKPDAALVKSVAAVGVLEPITVVLTDDGDLLVRYGHRRALAAVEAQVDAVPVYITGADATDTDAEVARIITQRDENTHRAGLSTADEVGVVEQLTAFGLSANQIAKQARIRRGDVDTALTVSGSAIARKATDRYADLTMDQAGVVADFEDDTETVKALLVAAHEGRFDHVAQRARDDRDEARDRAELVASLEAAGVSLIERPGYDDTKTAPLDRLAVDDTATDAITVEQHRDCPGHVVWLGTRWARVDADGRDVEGLYPDEPAQDADETAWEGYEDECNRIRQSARQVHRATAVYGCTGWRKHGHHDRHAFAYGAPSKPKAEDMTPEQREDAKTARKLVIENNKAWAAAEPVRREFLATVAKTKKAPKGTARFLATALGADSRVLHDVGASHLGAELLGKKPETGGFGWSHTVPTKSATDDKCLMHALVLTLAAYEAALTDTTWRRDNTDTAEGRYLRFLSGRCGYALSEVEEYAINSRTA